MNNNDNKNAITKNKIKLDNLHKINQWKFRVVLVQKPLELTNENQRHRGTESENHGVWSLDVLGVLSSMNFSQSQLPRPLPSFLHPVNHYIFQLLNSSPKFTIINIPQIVKTQ